MISEKRGIERHIGGIFIAERSVENLHIKAHFNKLFSVVTLLSAQYDFSPAEMQ